MAPVSWLLSTATNLLAGSSIVMPASFGIKTLDDVRSVLADSATKSWEIGTQSEALLELYWPSLSVFNESAFPPPTKISKDTNATDVFSIAHDTLSAKSKTSKTLVEDSAVGDPASLGVAMLLANWTRSNLTDDSLSTAARQQVDYLLNDAPRTASGAISHRADDVQLWADFIYMVPPFLAYFAVLDEETPEADMLGIAYEQISLYRDELRDEKTGLWRHIALGSYQDDTFWTTGNAWAAAGMLRVLKTMNNSDSSVHFQKQANNLTEWINEITTAAWSYQTENGSLHNVLDDETTFTDSAGTALLAAVTYRMAVHTNDTALVEHAGKALQVVQDSLTENGTLVNAVDPMTFHTPLKEGAVTAEGQAFVLMLEAATREFTEFFSTNSTKSDSETA